MKLHHPANPTDRHPTGALLVVTCITALLLPSGPTALAADADQFAGEKIVHLLQEPRHRTVHRDSDLHLLDVQVNPGDESFAHVHDQAVLLTYISDRNGPRDGAVSVNLDYASVPFTHKVGNAGPGLLRILAFVNGGQGTAVTTDQPTGFAEAPQVENAWFRSWRIELAPGAATPVQSHRQAGFAVLATPGLVHVTREDGITSELDSPGDWIWRNPEVGYTIRNAGSAPVSVVINEGRR